MKTLVVLIMSLATLVGRCQADPHAFIWAVLGCDGSEGRGKAWSRQREICRAVVEYPTVVVPSGNGVGKSWIGARLALWGASCFGPNIVFTSAPTQYQLESILWKEIADSWKRSKVPLGGSIGGSPIKWEISETQYAVGHVSNQVERMSGHHSGRLLAILDEASGVSETVYEAVDSLNPWRKLLIGNPLRSEGRFYDLCRKAEESPSPQIKLLRIPSTDSPDVALERSPRGMADQGFLRSMAFEYGQNSLWWRSHIDALFPNASDHILMPDAWLVAAKYVVVDPKDRKGKRRLAIDLALGNQGDETVICVRDDSGVLDMVGSNEWTLETAANAVKTKVEQWSVKPEDVVYDAAGIGADFGNRLANVGLKDAQGYLGARSGPRYANLRTASAWAARRRLDPDYSIDDGSKILKRQQPFSIPDPWCDKLRDEIKHIRVELDPLGRPMLEPKETLKDKLKRSPDWSDPFFMTFAYP